MIKHQEKDDKTSHGNTNSDKMIKHQHDSKISDKMIKHQSMDDKTSERVHKWQHHGKDAQMTQHHGKQNII